ncbi:MAG: HU family DNA-binding protein [Actinomycetota bacterium]|nr:HU family DNA-binding protein [Actinomycetota bacterium]
MNKSQLIDALAARYEGNRKNAAHALESVLDTITREVAKGEKVAITGFGSFEKRVRQARMVRNPRTGERIHAKKTSVPKFNAGADLKAVVSGAKKLPKLTIEAATSTAQPTVRKTAAAAKKTTSRATAKATPAKKSTAKKSTAKKSTAKKTTTRKTSAAKKSTAKRSPAKKSTAKKSPAKKSTAKKTTTRRTSAAKKSTAKRSPAKKSTAKKTTAKRSPAKKTTTAKRSTAKKS